jgi:hypothetical protein
MKNVLFVAIGVLLLQGCASSPVGSIWAYTDFNKYDNNYASFPTSQIRIGQSKTELDSLMNAKFNVVEAGEGYKVIAYQKWKSGPGSEQTFYIRQGNEHVKNWKLTSDTVEIVPRSW